MGMHSGRFEAAGAGPEWVGGVYPLLARLLDVAGCTNHQAQAINLHLRGLEPCQIAAALGCNRQQARVHLWGGIKRLARADTGWLQLERSQWRDLLLCLRNRRDGKRSDAPLLPSARPFGMAPEDLEGLDRRAGLRLTEDDPEWVLTQLLRRLEEERSEKERSEKERSEKERTAAGRKAEAARVQPVDRRRISAPVPLQRAA